jgi:spore coat protein U-like protein
MMPLMLFAPFLAGQANCLSIAVTALSFGSYTGAAIPVTATITANCKVGYNYAITLSAGHSGSTSARTMANASVNLSYSMYRDSAHTMNWGTNVGVDTQSQTGSGPGQIITIYGLLPAGQLFAPNTYTDSITASVPSVSGITSTFAVTATIPASCTFSAAALNFGSYTGLLLNVQSTVTVTCTNTTVFNIGFDAGTAPGATVTTRKMTGPASATLNYTIFKESTRTWNWGNTVNSDAFISEGDGTSHQYGTFGQVPAGQAPKPGSYSDTIIATITY